MKPEMKKNEESNTFKLGNLKSKTVMVSEKYFCQNNNFFVVCVNFKINSKKPSLLCDDFGRFQLIL